MSQSTTELEVAVIGAGLSGLSVARRLNASSKHFRVFEARSHSGGRVVSAPVEGGHADLGPTWFWPNEPRMRALVAEFDLAVHDQFSEGDAIYAADGQVRRASGFAAPPSFRFSDGAQSLTDALTDALPADAIEYNAPVERIEQDGDRIVVHLAAEKVTAEAVVLALPPSLVMSSGMIDAFTLDQNVAETAALIPVWMGGISKAVAVYEHAFWRELGLSGMISAPTSTFGEIHDMSGPDGTPAMLFGFAQAAGPTPATADAFAEQLSALFGPTTPKPIAVLGRDWSAEAFTTPASGNASQRYDLYGSPLLRSPSWNQNLHWASTETGAFAPGHLEGALEAAERTVAAILGG